MYSSCLRVSRFLLQNDLKWLIYCPPPTRNRLTKTTIYKFGEKPSGSTFRKRTPKFPLHCKDGREFMSLVDSGTLSEVHKNNVLTFFSVSDAAKNALFYPREVREAVCRIALEFLIQNEAVFEDWLRVWKSLQILRDFDFRKTDEFRKLFHRLVYKAMEDPRLSPSEVFSNFFPILAYYPSFQLDRDCYEKLASYGGSHLESFELESLCQFLWFWTFKHVSMKLSAFAPEVYQKWFAVSLDKITLLDHKHCTQLATAIAKETSAPPVEWSKAFGERILQQKDLSSHSASVILWCVAQEPGLGLDPALKAQLCNYCITEYGNRLFQERADFGAEGAVSFLWALGQLKVNPDSIYPKFMALFWNVSYGCLRKLNCSSQLMCRLLDGIWGLDTVVPDYWLQYAANLLLEPDNAQDAVMSLVQLGEIRKRSGEVEIDGLKIGRLASPITNNLATLIASDVNKVCQAVLLLKELSPDFKKLFNWDFWQAFLKLTEKRLKVMQLEVRLQLLETLLKSGVSIPSEWLQKFRDTMRIDSPEIAVSYLELLAFMTKEQRLTVFGEKMLETLKHRYTSSLPVLTPKSLLSGLNSVCSMAEEFPPSFWPDFWIAMDSNSSNIQLLTKACASLLKSLLDYEQPIPNHWISCLIHAHIVEAGLDLSSVFSSFELAAVLDNEDLVETVKLWSADHESVPLFSLCATIGELMHRKCDLEVLTDEFVQSFWKRVDSELLDCDWLALYVLTDLIGQFDVGQRGDWWMLVNGRLNLLIKK